MEKTEKRKSTKRVILIIVSAVLVLFVLACSFSPFGFPSWQDIFSISGIADFRGRPGDNELQLHFMDVDKADAILIKYKENAVLVDAGDYDGSNSVVEYMKRQNVNHLDMLVNTHPDKDHLGQMANVVYEIGTDCFVYSYLCDDESYFSTAYENLLFALDKGQVPTKEVKAGDSFSLGDVKIKVLAPISKNEKEINANSIVLKVIYGDTSFLLTGDANDDEEDEMLLSGEELKSDLIKIAHHGSKTSSSDEFLDSVEPMYAVLSVGQNDYNLPSQATMQRLYDRNINILRTDENGNIVVSSDGKRINVFTQK